MNVVEFKERTTNVMIKNFKIDGYLAPTIVSLIGGEIIPVGVPDEFMNSDRGKVAIKNTLQKIATMPGVMAVGFVFEAYGLHAEAGDEHVRQVQAGKRLSEMKESRDIIVFVYSTPERDEIVSFFVNPKTKEVLEPFIVSNGAGKSDGTFTNFFAYNRN